MRKHRPNCHASQIGQQIICGPCGLNWDAGDTDPPACRKSHRGPPEVIEELDRLPPRPKPPGARFGSLPDRLPASVAAEMERAHRSGGMQAAYRVLLDRMGDLC